MLSMPPIDLPCYSRDEVREGLAPVGCCCDVEIHQFVSTLPAIFLSQFHGISGLSKVDEVCAFDGLAVFDIKAGYDTFC